jgi:ABC-type iron transport system FetAB ATPase subunit
MNDSIRPPRLQVVGLATRRLGPLSLDLQAGECTTLSGPSGAGKTLLLRALADLDPHRGQVYLDGMAASHVSPDRWRKAVGMLPAESAWWYDTVGEHFPDGASPWVKALGFEGDVLGWTVRRLSTGEKARLALARLLGNRPRVLLLDEPTASLDSASVHRVEGAMASYRAEHDAAVLWVSHDPAQVQRVGQCSLYLDGGRLLGGEALSVRPSAGS